MKRNCQVSCLIALHMILFYTASTHSSIRRHTRSALATPQNDISSDIVYIEDNEYGSNIVNANSDASNYGFGNTIEYGYNVNNEYSLDSAYVFNNGYGANSGYNGNTLNN